MSQKIKNIATRLLDGKKLRTLAKSSFSAATASAATAHPRPYHPLPKASNAISREIIKSRIGPAKSLWEQCAMEMEKAKLEWERVMPMLQAYLKEVAESEGFDVTLHCPGFGGSIKRMNYSKDELVDRFNGPAKSAIELYNKKMDAKFKFVEIEKVNRAPPRTYLMTFTASDENDEPKVFQAALKANFNGDDLTVTLCRQKGNRLEEYKTDDHRRKGSRSGQQRSMKWL